MMINKQNETQPKFNGAQHIHCFDSKMSLVSNFHLVFAYVVSLKNLLRYSPKLLYLISLIFILYPIKDSNEDDNKKGVEIWI